MSALEIAKSAFKYIENPNTWTRYTLARTEDGVSTHTKDPLACKFCSFGAITRAIYDNNCSFSERVLVERALNQASLEVASRASIISVNDNSPHEEVVRVWEKAIDILKNDWE